MYFNNVSINTPMYKRRVYNILDLNRLGYDIDSFENSSGHSLFLFEKNLQEIIQEELCNRNFSIIDIKIAIKLNECHLKGVIHRDIKPDNILVNSLMEPKIIDYQSSELSDEPLKNNIGAPLFKAPEISKGNHDNRSDIYSFGLVFYYIHCGVIPLDISLDKPVSEQLKYGLVYQPSLPYIFELLTMPNPNERMTLDQFITVRQIENLLYNRETVDIPDGWLGIEELENLLCRLMKFDIDDIYRLFQMGIGFSYALNDRLALAAAIDPNEKDLLDLQFLFQGLNTKEMPHCFDLLDEQTRIDILHSLHRPTYDEVAQDLNQFLIEGMNNNFMIVATDFIISSKYAIYIHEHLMYVLDEYPVCFLQLYLDCLAIKQPPQFDRFRYYQLVLRSIEKETIIYAPFFISEIGLAIKKGIIASNDPIGDSTDLYHSAFLTASKPPKFRYSKVGSTVLQDKYIYFEGRVEYLTKYEAANYEDVAYAYITSKNKVIQALGYMLFAILFQREEYIDRAHEFNVSLRFFDISNLHGILPCDYVNMIRYYEEFALSPKKEYWSCIYIDSYIVYKPFFWRNKFKLYILIISRNGISYFHFFSIQKLYIY